MPRGSLVDQMEQTVEAVSGEMVKRARSLINSVGDRPPFSEKLSEEAQAQRYLPLWVLYGHAEGPVAEQFWSNLVKEHGPKGAFSFDTRMRRLYEKYGEQWQTWAGPELSTQYQQMIASGLHLGAVKPPLMPAERSTHGGTHTEQPAAGGREYPAPAEQQPVQPTAPTAQAY